jgi:hypothetical protein
MDSSLLFYEVCRENSEPGSDPVEYNGWGSDSLQKATFSPNCVYFVLRRNRNLYGILIGVSTPAVLYPGKRPSSEGKVSELRLGTSKVVSTPCPVRPFWTSSRDFSERAIAALVKYGNNPTKEGSVPQTCLLSSQKVFFLFNKSGRGYLADSPGRQQDAR